MKNIQNKLIVFLVIILAFPHIGSSQDSFTNELSYEVNRVFPPISITKNQLEEAQNLSDFDKLFRPSWVREYISVEISASQKGMLKKVSGKNNTLTSDQKDLIKMADAGTKISVKVDYIPENNLKVNDARVETFSFKVAPSEAEYYGGQKQLNQYLEDKAINKISVENFRKVNFNLAAVKFTVNEDGQIINPHIVETSKNEEVDKLLVNAISNMPNWKPSEYPNGTKVKQEYVLTVGDHRSCTINLLDIQRDLTVRNK